MKYQVLIQEMLKNGIYISFILTKWLKFAIINVSGVQKMKAMD